MLNVKNDNQQCWLAVSTMEAVMSFASGEPDAWGRAANVTDFPCIYAWSSNAAFRLLSMVCGIVRDSFQETLPRKTAENTVKQTLWWRCWSFNGSQSYQWWWKFGGRNNTTEKWSLACAVCDVCVCVLTGFWFEASRINIIHYLLNEEWCYIHRYTCNVKFVPIGHKWSGKSAALLYLW